ncbi:MAG: YicC/YloC family endoribonuclease [Sneathiella sp.]
MTGFARASGEYEDFTWLWEIKSVNGRGLETRCRLPGGFDRVEEVARKQIKARFQRGSINLHLQLSRNSDKGNYQINSLFLEEVQKVAHALVEAGQATKPTADGLLALKGVIEVGDPQQDEKQQEKLETALLKTLDDVLGKLEATRIEEGSQLLPVLKGQIDEIAGLVVQAEEVSNARLEKTQERVTKQIEMILSQAASLDEGRLEQELAILATKADISEELDRLKGHVQTTQDLLTPDQDGAIGRRLDFICQEFNREANTLCSKAGDKELTKIGLDLKVVIDRLREQVQNIE